MPAAPQRRASASSRMRGGTLLGFLIGLVAGMATAVVVAVIVRPPVTTVRR